jgi:hypothetical protein
MEHYSALKNKTDIKFQEVILKKRKKNSGEDTERRIG